MSSLQSYLAATMSPAKDLRHLFRLNGEKALPIAPLHLPHISSCLVSEEKQKSAPSISTSNLPLSAKSKDLIERENRVLIGTYARAPVVLVRGKGCKLYDIDGMEYVDMAAGIAVNSLGYGDGDWVKTVLEQAVSLAHISNVYYSEPQVILAEHLVECSFADRVFFTNSGTEANEAAIKFARKYQRFSSDSNTHATEFVSFSNSFHGRTLGALALTSKEKYRLPFEPVMPGVKFVEYGDIDGAKKAIVSGKTAGVFVEPIQGEGGIHSATKEFLQSLRAACDDVGALLIFDEVQCGLGRTGHLWAHESYGVVPDIMTLAKPLAGGLPIGVALTTEKVAATISYGDHGSTFAGSPLVCHAALTVLKKIKEPNFLSAVTKKGLYFKELLTHKLGSNLHVKEVRGLGLIVGIELDGLASPFVDACRSSGLLVLTAGKGNVVRLVPPLVISEEELEQAVDIMERDVCLHLKLLVFIKHQNWRLGIYYGICISYSSRNLELFIYYWCHLMLHCDFNFLLYFCLDDYKI